MNLKDFETLYGAASEIQKIAGSEPVVAEALRKQRRVLTKYLSGVFPDTLKGGLLDPSFDIVQFMDMLVKYPELARLNAQKFVSLMEDLIEQGIEISPSLRDMLEVMKEKPEEMSKEEKEIGALLEKSFPRNVEELAQMPFSSEKVVAFIEKHIAITEGKRNSFINLMVDMSQKKMSIPVALKQCWRSMVMQP